MMKDDPDVINKDYFVPLHRSLLQRHKELRDKHHSFSTEHRKQVEVYNLWLQTLPASVLESLKA
jgi:hypothetical protein